MSHIPRSLSYYLLSFLDFIWTFYHSIRYILLRFVFSPARPFVQVERHEDASSLSSLSFSLTSQKEQWAADDKIPCLPPLDIASAAFGCTVASSIPLSRSPLHSSFGSDASFNKIQYEVRTVDLDANVTRTSIWDSSWVTAESQISSLPASISRPKPSSLKSCLKTPQQVETATVSRKVFTATVRFAEPEPQPKPQKWPSPIQQQQPIRQFPAPLINRIPSPPTMQFENCGASPFPGTSSGQQTWYPDRSLYGLSPSPGGQAYYNHPRTRVITGIYTQPAPVVQQEPRWPTSPHMMRHNPGFLSQESRTYSNQSAASTPSSHPYQQPPQVPPEICRPPAAAFPQPQFYPSFQQQYPQQYMYPRYQQTYIPAHVGPPYYIPQDPYALYQHQAQQYAALAMRDLERNQMQRM